jgi:hypothetical protein
MAARLAGDWSTATTIGAVRAWLFSRTFFVGVTTVLIGNLLVS